MQTPNHSLIAIFEAISSRDGITRREISDITGFSQVTVGKTVDILSDAGIIARQKKTVDGVGRKGDICTLNKNRGMMLFDASEEKIRMTICDMGLNILFESVAEDFSELVMNGLAKTAELSFESVPVIGCICKKGDEEKTAKIFTDLLGNSPDVICCVGDANALANHRRFGYDDEIFVRIFADGSGFGTIMKGGQLHRGSHGKAGIFSRGESIEVFIRRVCGIGEALDTALIHVSCDEEVRDDVNTAVNGFFTRLEIKPEVVTEAPNDCPDVILGLGAAVRSNFLFGLLSK